MYIYVRSLRVDLFGTLGELWNCSQQHELTFNLYSVIIQSFQTERAQQFCEKKQSTHLNPFITLTFTNFITDFQDQLQRILPSVT